MVNNSTIQSDLRDARDDDMLSDREAEFITSSPETNPISLLFYEYELAQGATPNDPAIHFNFGVAALEQELESYAIEALTKYVRAVPEDADGFYQLGLAYAAKGSFRDAARRYEQAQKLNPDDADILIALHFAYFNLHRFKDAAICIEKAEAISSHFAGASVDPRFFQFWKGINLLLAGGAKDAELLLIEAEDDDSAIGEGACYALALLAIQRNDCQAVEQRRSQLEKAESYLLTPLRAAITRWTVEPGEVVGALTGRPSQP